MAEPATAAGRGCLPRETSYPDDFAYAFFGTQGSDFTIGFKDDVPAEIVGALSKTGLSYSIDEHVGFTQSDYENATASVIREFDGPPDSLGQMEV